VRVFTPFQKRLLAMLLLRALLPTQSGVFMKSHGYSRVRVNTESWPELVPIQDILHVSEIDQEGEEKISLEVELLHPEQLLAQWLECTPLPLERQFNQMIEGKVYLPPDEMRNKLDIFL
jgi:hypothetical protein